MATLKSWVRVMAGLALIASATGKPAQAVTLTETSAGSLLSDAQIIPAGSATLDSISGTLLSGNDVDLFQITLTGGRTFSATTEGMADFDTQLFLFDKNGLGVYARDDNPTSLQSTLPASHPLTPVVPEAYYLAIASFNNDPISSRGLIFDNDEFPPYNKVLGPIIPGSEKPLSGFNDLGSGSGSYRIAITGATAVPELSSTLGTLAFGAFAVSWMLKRKLKSRQSAASHNPSKA